MTTKVVKVLKYLGLFSIVFFTIISCEKEIESIGVNLVDNNNFSSNTLTTDVITANENVERVISNGVSQYLLGVYSDPEFGKLEASIVSQLTLPLISEEFSTTAEDGYYYGTNPAIDSVIVDIPYQTTLDSELYLTGVRDFSIDSIIGDSDVEFKLSIYELKTFLNTLDPNDPSKLAVYYSDKEFLKGDIPFYSGNFKVNPNDTVSYIKRYMADAITVYDIDTIRQSDLGPSIKVPLDESVVQQFFVDNALGIEFDSNDNFRNYFRGMYIETEEFVSANSHLISLDMLNAKMTIYYSNDQDEAEGVDLNENEITGESGVRINESYQFAFGTIKANVLKRDYTVSHQSGEDRLYVQGAAGSIATVEILNGQDLNNLRSKNLLITDASLIFYVDQNASSNIAPEQLFLFNYDENSQILDIMTEGLLAVGGSLERDEEGNPYRYEFKITDYISELLISEEPLDLVKLGLKVYNPSDLPLDYTDDTIKDFNWNPKGVVLYGHDSSAGDKNIKFEISYSELNTD